MGSVFLRRVEHSPKSCCIYFQFEDLFFDLPFCNLEIPLYSFTFAFTTHAPTLETFVCYFPFVLIKLLQESYLFCHNSAVMLCLSRWKWVALQPIAIERS